MTFQEFYKITKLLLLAVLIVLACVILHRCNKTPRTIVQTTTKTDTIRITKPTPTDTVYLTKTVTKAIEVPYKEIKYENGTSDTLILFDTLKMELPMEQRIYQDSLYTAWVSGVEPSLDSIEVYHKTVTNTITKKKKQWFTFGPSVGYGYGVFNHKPDLYVGVTATLNLMP